MKKVNDEQQLENLLRPNSWKDYIGQEQVKKGLQMILTAAKKRKESADHLLFCGQAGLGKTTLAHLIAKEMGVNLRITSGAAMDKKGDLVAALSSIEPNEVFFIDEVHRLNRMIEEILYPAMETRKLHITIGKGPGARIYSLDLPAFTLVAATTRPNLLSVPLRSRFGAIFHIDYYNIDDIKDIIQRSCRILGIETDKEATDVIAKASRFTPRIANRLLKRSRDFAQVNNLTRIDKKTALATLDLLEIDELGLEKWDRRLLETIIKRFNGGPVGIKNLASALGEDKSIIEDIYEPFLVKIGFIHRTPTGRIAGREAYNHLGYD